MDSSRILVFSIIGFLILVGAGLMFQENIGNMLIQPQDTDLEGVNSSGVSTEVVARNLEVPWGIEFLPNNDILVTERPGTLRRIGEINQTYSISGVQESGESGLLGIELHPNFTQNRYLYLYHTQESENGLENRVVRYQLQEGQLQDQQTIISDIPGAPYHDGGRLEFGPNGYLYVTVGDATEESKAQDRTTLHGNILRLTGNGSVPEENPFGTPVYSYGHRNPQGLTWDAEGRLWSTEHGRSGVRSGLDEINIIRSGENYGWPVIEGSETREGMVAPVIHSGADTTWAPASAEYVNGSIFFGGLRGQSLYEAEVSGSQVTSVKAHFKDEFGRVREVELGPDGYLYLTTSNRDGRGSPQRSDDRIIRVDPGSIE